MCIRLPAYQYAQCNSVSLVSLIKVRATHTALYTHVLPTRTTLAFDDLDTRTAGVMLSRAWTWRTAIFVRILERTAM
jgi:hypothetical protein